MCKEDILIKISVLSQVPPNQVKVIHQEEWEQLLEHDTQLQLEVAKKSQRLCMGEIPHSEEWAKSCLVLTP